MVVKQLKTRTILWCLLCMLSMQALPLCAQKDILKKVNVFLGSSGDYGQLSPAAGSPFGLMGIAPQTYPNTHTGYEYKAKRTLGFTHNRFEGTGCKGGGGILLIKPFIEQELKKDLIKSEEEAGPGYYNSTYTNGIRAKIAVDRNQGVHIYEFPKSKTKGIYVDLSHAINNGFVAEEHTIRGSTISGWIDAKTICHKGVFRTYYTISVNSPVKWTTVDTNSKLAAYFPAAKKNSLQLSVSFSSVDLSYTANQQLNYDHVRAHSTAQWKDVLGRISVKGEKETENLFYSLLYRTLQTPFRISEENGSFRTIDGRLRKDQNPRYNGWAIWDNFKTQLPFLSLAYPEEFQGIVNSIFDLYPYGKKDFSTKSEPSNTVRTEHAIVVLLDAYRKGYKVDFPKILDSLQTEVLNQSYNSPDKALESAYDAWALAEIYKELGFNEQSKRFTDLCATYKSIWLKDFKTLKVRDADVMGARNMYQGTIWQYRWSVPFDVQGLIQLDGGEESFLKKLDKFFEEDYFNRANQPDLQAPLLYNATQMPWKAQHWMYAFARDTINNFYFNDNSKGVYAEITRLFKNQPEAFVRTMDNDGGSMSSWYLLTAIGLHPALVGEPIYYFNTPLFKEVQILLPTGKQIRIKVLNYNIKNRYIHSLTVNGKVSEKNWISHNELVNGATIEIYTSNEPNKNWGISNQWASLLSVE